MSNVGIASLTKSHPTLVNDLGEKYYKAGKGFLFVKAGAALAKGDWVVIDETLVAELLADGSKGRVGVVCAAAAENEYVWIQREGKNTDAKSTSVDDNDLLYTSDTDGTIGDDATGHTFIDRAIARGATSGGKSVVELDSPFANGVVLS